MRVGFIILFFLYSCTSEPRGIVYEFKMINDTDTDYVIKKHYRDSKNNSGIDTLFAGSEINFSVPRVGSYDQPFGESLISSFFDTLIVRRADAKMMINVHKRSNWKEKVELDNDFMEKEGSMKGKVIYTLKMKSVIK